MIQRPFLIDEVVLGRFAGSVRGTVVMDPQWGIVDRVTDAGFDFHDRHTDQPVVLGSEHRRAVLRMTVAVLEMEPELFASTKPLNLSASAAPWHLVDDAAGEETLAQFLADPRAPVDRHVADRQSHDRQRHDRRIRRAE